MRRSIRRFSLAACAVLLPLAALAGDPQPTEPEASSEAGAPSPDRPRRFGRSSSAAGAASGAPPVSRAGRAPHVRATPRRGRCARRSGWSALTGTPRRHTSRPARNAMTSIALPGPAPSLRTPRHSPHRGGASSASASSATDHLVSSAGTARMTVLREGWPPERARRWVFDSGPLRSGTARRRAAGHAPNERVRKWCPADRHKPTSAS